MYFLFLWKLLNIIYACYYPVLISVKKFSYIRKVDLFVICAWLKIKAVGWNRNERIPDVLEFCQKKPGIRSFLSEYI